MVEIEAKLTCPHCNKTYEVEMPLNYCRILFNCDACNQDIIPKEGDCCIFCSYADKKCPPLQIGEIKFENTKN
jgi:hypothetical protein